MIIRSEPLTDANQVLRHVLHVVSKQVLPIAPATKNATSMGGTESDRNNRRLFRLNSAVPGQ